MEKKRRYKISNKCLFKYLRKYEILDSFVKYNDEKCYQNRTPKNIDFESFIEKM